MKSTILLLSLSWSLLLMGCKEKHSHAGMDFALKTLDGKEYTLSGQKGKIVVLDFWATWCPPCLRAIPVFNAVNEKHKDTGVLILGIVLDGEVALRKFLQQHTISYPVVIGNAEVAKKFSIQSIPTTYIIDQNGTIVSKHVGLAHDLQELLEKEIDKLRKIKE